MKGKLAKKLISVALCASMIVTGGCSAKSTKDDNTVNDMAANSDENAGKVSSNEESGNSEGEAEVDDSIWEVNMSDIETATIDAGAAVHDPSIIKVDGSYYIFGSHMTGAVSTDLRHFEYIGNGYANGNKLFDNLLSCEEAFAYAGSATSLIPTDDGTRHVWAEDVFYNETTGLYYMYFCMSSTWNASNLCFATSENIDGPYTWRKALIYSGFTSDTIDGTDVCDYVEKEEALSRYTTKSGTEYNYNDYPNAIDPTVFYDEDGRIWMVYGSWSGGIYLIEIDPETGECIHPEENADENVDAYFGKRLIGGKHRSIEGPWIEYDEDAGYYYLFVSYGSLNRDGGYQIRVFRSETVDGEYVDMNGNTCAYDSGNHKYQGLKLTGNYYLPSMDTAAMATGHNSALIDDDGKKYICYHTRFDDGTENFKDRVKQYFLNKEGWPCMLPYATSGETIENVTSSDVVGTYYVVNQGIEIDSEIAEPFMLQLLDDYTVKGDAIEGTWSLEDGSYYMTISYGDETYSGVFCEQTDDAGTNVMTFTAVGSNMSLWGVHYY